MSPQVRIQTRGKARKLLSSALRKPIQRQLRRALVATACPPQTEVCLSFSDDEELAQLNSLYAGESHATDVLSFAQTNVLTTTVSPMLGDIVISVETAARQAQQGGHPLAYELLHLAVHGLCHLLGYDHATQEEERVMFGYEALLRKQALGKGRVYKTPPPPLRPKDNEKAFLDATPLADSHQM